MGNLLSSQPQLWKSMSWIVLKFLNTASKLWEYIKYKVSDSCELWLLSYRIPEFRPRGTFQPDLTYFNLQEYIFQLRYKATLKYYFYLLLKEKKFLFDFFLLLHAHMVRNFNHLFNLKFLTSSFSMNPSSNFSKTFFRYPCC